MTQQAYQQIKRAMDDAGIDSTDQDAIRQMIMNGEDEDAISDLRIMCKEEGYELFTGRDGWDVMAIQVYDPRYDAPYVTNFNR